MFFKNEVSDKYIQCFTPYVSCGTNIDYDYDIPAWSLSALIKMLPKGFLLIDDQGESESGLYSVWVPGFNSPHIWKDNSLDAVFEMVVWLKENNTMKI
jgi:hypothetical protein